MDYQVLFDIACGIAAFFVGWVVRNIHDAVKDLQLTDKQLAEKVASIEILVAGGYVRREEFDRAVSAIFIKLDKIDEKISNKLDKRLD